MPVLEQIVELLGLPEHGTDAPTLARIEEILTSGYAQALALEAERLRLEKRLAEVARGSNVGLEEIPRELMSISEQLASADGELTRLRAVLDRLNVRARAARSAA
ncbi:MAG TPA: hypothetical protein VHD91_05175 [Gaiellaceae bacterium]|nr:hypothetical protein [Gaiellaceae bacterium]